MSARVAEALLLAMQRETLRESYTEGTPLVLCPVCSMRGNADRNASLRIGHRLLARYQRSVQEKPLAPLAIEREEKSSGVGHSQDAKSKDRPSTDHARHGEVNGPGPRPGTKEHGWMRCSALFLLHYGIYRVAATLHFLAYRVQKRGERSRAIGNRGGVSLPVLKPY